MSNSNRRNAIKNIVAGSAAVIAGGNIISSFAASPNVATESIIKKLKGNINHSVCRWCFNKMKLDDLCKAVKKIGFSAIDLVGPADWPVLQQYGVHSSMCYTAGDNNLTKGWADKSQHARLVKDFTEIIPLMVKAGYKSVIGFSGNRNGMDDETGLKNCVEGLKKVLPLAEKNGIVVHMELLNSKIDHKDYMCDRTAWGVELCKRLSTENFKLLYDIYHMQVDEGDVIRTIRDNIKYIGHFHTAGVPGRNEIDDTQELYYPAIMRAVKDLNFKGYVAQEFIPKATDKMASLKKAIEICDV